MEAQYLMYEQDGPELMAEEAKTLGYPFPYLYDEVSSLWLYLSLSLSLYFIQDIPSKFFFKHFFRIIVGDHWETLTIDHFSSTIYVEVMHSLECLYNIVRKWLGKHFPILI